MYIDSPGVERVVALYRMKKNQTAAAAIPTTMISGSMQEKKVITPRKSFRGSRTSLMGSKSSFITSLVLMTDAVYHSYPGQYSSAFWVRPRLEAPGAEGHTASKGGNSIGRDIQ